MTGNDTADGYLGFNRYVLLFQPARTYSDLQELYILCKKLKVYRKKYIYINIYKDLYIYIFYMTVLVVLYVIMDSYAGLCQSREEG